MSENRIVEINTLVDRNGQLCTFIMRKHTARVYNLTEAQCNRLSQAVYDNMGTLVVRPFLDGIGWVADRKRERL